MPVELPQFSRRAFLKCAALVGGGLALAPYANAGLFGKARDKHTFALLSDTHIAADPARVSRDVNMADHLTAVGRELGGLPKKPAAVLINGDLALKAGLPGDYSTFANLLTPIRAIAAVHLTLGNHDDRAKVWAAFPREAAAQRPVQDKSVAILRSPLANWFLLDSLDVTDSTPGDLGAAQLAWLDRELTTRADEPAIIIGHHNLNAPGVVAGLKDSDAFVKLFGRHRQVKAFIFGHTHNWSVKTHETGVHLINLPPVAYVFKEGRPSGWVRATLQRDGLELELRSLDKSHPEHGKVQQLKWRKEA
jgi:3',5'-cyclic-AMP phosphodiesterase